MAKAHQPNLLKDSGSCHRTPGLHGVGGTGQSTEPVPGSSPESGKDWREGKCWSSHMCLGRQRLQWSSGSFSSVLLPNPQMPLPLTECHSGASFQEGGNGSCGPSVGSPMCSLLQTRKYNNGINWMGIMLVACLEILFILDPKPLFIEQIFVELMLSAW